jgi:hypothetical protein
MSCLYRISPWAAAAQRKGRQCCTRTNEGPYAVVVVEGLESFWTLRKGRWCCMQTNEGPCAVVVAEGLESFWTMQKSRWCSTRTDEGLCAVVVAEVLENFWTLQKGQGPGPLTMLSRPTYFRWNSFTQKPYFSHQGHRVTWVHQRVHCLCADQQVAQQCTHNVPPSHNASEPEPGGYP